MLLNYAHVDMISCGMLTVAVNRLEKLFRSLVRIQISEFRTELCHELPDVPLRNDHFD